MILRQNQQQIAAAKLQLGCRERHGFVGFRFEDFSAFINVTIVESIDNRGFDFRLLCILALLQSPHPDASPAARKLPQPDSPA